MTTQTVQSSQQGVVKQLAAKIQRTLENKPMHKRVKRQKRLPLQIIPLGNADKKFHEKWYEGRDLLDIPHPFRMVLASRPNGGKTTVIKNIILRARQGETPFEHIVIVHCDPENTKEYSDLGDGVNMVGEIPSVEEFEGVLKTLVILEDLNYLDMGIQEKGRLERLFGYASTHKNISCMLTAQDPFRIMATVRRCTNIFVIWNNHDQTMIKTLASKLGIDPKKLTTVFQQKCPHTHDNLWFDFTTSSPAETRLNGYEKFNLLE